MPITIRITSRVEASIKDELKRRTYPQTIAEIILTLYVKLVQMF